MGTEERLGHFRKIEVNKLVEGLKYLEELDKQEPELRRINQKLNETRQIKEYTVLKFDQNGNLKRPSKN